MNRFIITHKILSELGFASEFIQGADGRGYLNYKLYNFHFFKCLEDEEYVITSHSFKIGESDEQVNTATELYQIVMFYNMTRKRGQKKLKIQKG